MEQTQSNKVRYTVKYFGSISGGGSAACPAHVISQNEPPPELRDVYQERDANPVIEIVTTVDVVNACSRIPLEKCDFPGITTARSTHMIVHSEALSQTIRDVVKFYPGQNLTGAILVIREPYACLLHHMSDLEHLLASNGDPTELEPVQALLEFLRPQYRKCYTLARDRSLAAEPTVMFDDLWVIMKPGLPAYADWHGLKIGCVIGKSILLPPDDSQHLPERWSIDFMFLQVSWSSDQIGYNLQTAVIDRFEGERLITSLPIHPSEFLDAQDHGVTKKRFTDRGGKVCEILWGDSMYMEYDGECMDRTQQSYTGRIVVGGSDDTKELYLEHDWGFNWVPLGELMEGPDDHLSKIKSMVNPKTDGRDVLSSNHLFILSPCLSAFRLSTNDWAPITAENVQPLSRNDDYLSPIVDNDKLEMIQRLVNSHPNRNISQTGLPRYEGGGFVIHLEGPPGVGKSSLLELVSLRSRCPLVACGLGDLGIEPGEVQTNMAKYLSICRRLNAMLLIDNCDEIMRFGADVLTTTVFIEALRGSRGIIFLTTNRGLGFDPSFHPVISFSVRLPEPGPKTHDLVWLNLRRRLDTEEGIRLHQSAAKFLGSLPARVANWNGHEITRCFKIAVALAANQTERSRDDTIIVEETHFKEAMNVVHGLHLARRAHHPPPPMLLPTANGVGANPHRAEEYPVPRMANNTRKQAAPFNIEPRVKGIIGPTVLPRAEDPTKMAQPIDLNSDSDICIPGLNHVEWDAFRDAGKNELFRRTTFHAIDVLKGEPMIKLPSDDRREQKRRDLARKEVYMGSTIIGTTGRDRGRPKVFEPREEPLPQRIRINSPAIIRASAAIFKEEIQGPFLLFRPFRSLIYYEQEFRDEISRQENVIKDLSAPNAQTAIQKQDLDDERENANDNQEYASSSEESIDNETKKRLASAGLEQMRCLLSFIENEVKNKQQYLRSSDCQSLPFANVPLLFTPGDTVISKDGKQAYRVIKVSCIRHRVKHQKEETSLGFLRNEIGVEQDDNPVFVHCTYLDFDGQVMGPVFRIFMISKYEGEKELTSLPIVLLQHAATNGCRERLVERGKLFLKLIGIRHMHYTGLTMKTNDDIDSQVVIDFEEAVNRHPQWKPRIASVLDEFTRKEVNLNDVPDSDDNINLHFLKARKSMSKPCIEECCADEFVFYDEYVEDRMREDYIVSRMNKTVPSPLPVTIMPQDIHDIKENNTLTDDEYLIMAQRVFGFVLRSRKWHELDMAHLFEVATLGAGEGFDELVLPPGHGDMVKSMIRQHLRDRNLSSVNRDRTDVVRGKGRGLIILLHGVPGVGKTSTAECVADLFRRPLFQITSGDLGTTAKEVEDALEENFSLASRWNSILLIDEADVFLAERTKEDFVRNSLVAVFLRMMEYYAGVLFLTTNRVGVFDEAFTSRIHISLYYPPLDRKSTLQIFQKNWDRISTRYRQAGRVIDIDTSEITEFAIDYFENNKEGRWNGRQIRNAFQSALALAELDALGTDDFMDETDHNRPVALGRKSFDTVAEAYKGFTSYLKQVYGADFARRARENLWRFDAFGSTRTPNNLNTRLNIAETAMPPPPAQWPGQNYMGYDPRFSQPYYPPQQHYAEGSGQSGQRPSYPPTSRPQQYPDLGERWDARAGSGGFEQ